MIWSRLNEQKPDFAGTTDDLISIFAYSSEDLLTSLANSAPGAVQPNIAFSYDPLMRLAAIDSTNSGFDVEFGYDGQEMVLESLSAGRTRRYVHGPGTDEPLVGYLVTPGVGTSRLWYQADERGSIVRNSNDSGTPHATVGKYDEYGAGGTGRFRYTGQYWLGEANLLYYRARVYDARLGRFLQPDPIGYGGGMNMYAYVGGDPVNFVDPLGLQEDVIHPDITINGGRLQVASPAAAVAAVAALMGGMRGGWRLLGPDGGSDGGGIPETQPLCLAPPPAVSPSAKTTSRAVNNALKEIYGAKPGPVTNPMSREFARLSAMPDFSKAPWQPSWSGHSGYAWEAPIPSFAGHVVKVYVNDREAGGAISATITSTTSSLDHILAYAVNVTTGYVGNADNAVEYLEEQNLCR